MIAGVLIAVAVIAVWELVVRSLGYAPTLNDTADLWAANRAALARSSPDRAVAIGSSRIMFDLDLDAYAEHFKTKKPIQLAIPGSNPLEVLEMLAADGRFAGLVLVGVVPGLYFAPEGMPVDNTRHAIRRYENWSPSQRIGHELSKILQKSFAFIQQEDLTLNHLLARLPIPDRAGTKGNLPPRLPPYFASVEDDRRARLWEKCDFGSSLALEIQQIWIPLFTPPSPPPHVSEEEFRQMFMESMDNELRRTRESVDEILSRGGEVVFVRFPSTRTLRELENQFSPRPGFWDRLISSSGAPGIHFEDYETLRGFDCPEWSHLTDADAGRFSKNLMPILEQTITEAARRRPSP